jgi:arylsulfatase A-like enzyme/Flp pilus assembly protein TadD
VAAGLLLAGCSRRPREASFPGAPVVLVSIDTLRSDHLPAYGYRGVETPAFDAFRRDSVLVTRVYAHAPLTLPSHLTVFTGRLPAATGVHDNLGYTLDPRVPTLAQVLKNAGYETGGAVSAVVLASRSGVARGFDFWDDAVGAVGSASALSLVQRAGNETEAKLETWLTPRVGGRFLAFLHLYEPHSPYEPPEPFRSRYAGRPYDGEIAAADAVLGRFVSFLKERGVYDRAIVAVFSDHGESLGEHGEDEHGFFLYRSALEVPLLLKLPRRERAGTAIDGPAGLSDLFPTLLELAAVTAPASPDGAHDLLSPRRDGPPRRIFSETFFPRIHLGCADLASEIEGSDHYIDAPHPELYELAADPGETKDLAGGLPPQLRSLRLDVARKRAAFASPDAAGVEDKAKLASLGYVSAGAPEMGDLDDPKHGIATFARIKRALAFESDGRDEDAARELRALLDENPRMLDVWEAYSRSLFRLGRGEESLAAMRKTVELAPPGATSYLLSLAELEIRLGRLDEAIASARLARERGDAGGASVAARATLAKGDLEGAERWAREAAAAPEYAAAAGLTLARISEVRGDVPAALARLDEAEKASRERGVPLRGLRQARGDLCARANRPQEAERELLAELRAFPDNKQARAALAALYGAEGRLPEARAAIAALLSGTRTREDEAVARRLQSLIANRAAARARLQ